MIDRTVKLRFYSDGRMISWEEALTMNFEFLMTSLDVIRMRYVGIADQSGQEIYEDDIVERLCNNPGCDFLHKGRVIYYIPFCTYHIDESEHRGWPLAVGSPKAIMPITILGNIHENEEYKKLYVY